MNIVFFGSSQFAVLSLKALFTTKHEISCVVTQPDRPKGRGLTLAPTPVNIAAQELGLKIYQPTQINTTEAIKFLKDLQPDLFVVVAYGQILSQGTLDIPKIFSINVHASLLPKYCGAAPINWAIIKGEKTTGITIIKMVKEMDAGPIILQEELDINLEDTAISLEDKLAHLGAKVLIESLEALEKGGYDLISQDEKNISFAPKLKKEDGLIDWDKPSDEVCNLIRGCLPWPGAFTYYQGKILKIYKAKVISLSRYLVVSAPGEIINVSKEGIVVATGKDNLIIEELQIEGKRRMGVAEFMVGHKVSLGERLGKK